MKKQKKFYRTKKRKNAIKKAYAILLAIIISSAVIGNQSVRTEKTIDEMTKANPIVRIKKIIIKEVKAQEEAVKIKKEPTVMQKVHDQAYIQCQLRGFGDWCVKDLKAMVFTETRFKCNDVGDNGKSYGCYQIHLGYHPHITKEQARDISWSTAWTLNRLVQNGYPEYRSRAIMMHNGTPNTDKTRAYLSTINNYINNNLGGM